MTRSTHTLAHMPVTAATHEEIKRHLLEAGYDHAVLDEDHMLDMTGIALVPFITKTERPALLMSADNPNGHKLEELLDQIIDEVCAKTQRLRDFEKTDAFAAQTPLQQSTTKAVIRGNQEICRLLRGAVERHHYSMDLLSKVGKDQGPTGQHRIGPGSVPPLTNPGVGTAQFIEAHGHDCI